MNYPALLLAIAFAFVLLGSASAREPGFTPSAGFGARSRPLGVAGFGELAYDQPLWGAWTDEESPWYGYLRPQLRATTALWINELDISLQLRPLSFLGLTVGRAETWRSRDQSMVVDCALLLCDGRLRADYGTLNVTLGTASVFVTSELDLRDFRPSDDAEGFYEDGSALRGRRGYDRQFSQTYSVGTKALGRRYSVPSLAVGLTAKRVEFHRSGDFSERLSLVAQYSLGALKYSYAVGAYRSSVLETAGPAIGLSLEWVPPGGLSL